MSAELAVALLRGEQVADLCEQLFLRRGHIGRTLAASAALGFMGFMKAAFGARPVFSDAAELLLVVLEADFLVVAIACLS